MPLPRPIRRSLGHGGREKAHATQSERYLPGLDGIRAIGLTLVVLYHANSKWLPGAVLSVDIFFVISGYLITLLLLREHDDGRIGIKRFYLRRARRLLPALLTMLFVLTLWVALFSRDELGNLRGDLLAGTLYVSNWYQIFVGASYTAASDFVPLRNLWSLAVEEQFYLLWPPALLVLLRYRKRIIVALLLGLTALVGVGVAALTPSGSILVCDSTTDAYWRIGERCIGKLDALYLSTPARAIGLLLGAAFAFLWRPTAASVATRTSMEAKRRMLDLGSLAAAGVIAYCVVNVGVLRYVADVGPVTNPALFPGGLIATCLSALLLLAAATTPGTLTGRLLSGRLLTQLGQRSYGIYLYHWPVFQVIRRQAGLALTGGQLLVGIAVTLLLSESTYRLIEDPIRREGFGAWRASTLARIGRRAQTRAVGVLLAGVLAVGGVHAGVGLLSEPARANFVKRTLQEAQGSVVDAVEQAGSGEGAGDFEAPHFPLFAVGESIMKGAAYELTQLGFLVDAQEGRQAATGAEILRQLDVVGVTIDTAVVHLGTNGTVTEETLTAIADALEQTPRVIILTVIGVGAWIDDNNERIRALAEERSNITLLDWHRLRADCPGDCVTDDRIHLTEEGNAYYVSLIAQAAGLTVAD